MKNRLFRFLALALLLALTVGMAPAMAETKKVKIVPETMYTGCGEYWLNVENWTGNEESVLVKSSNSSVLKVKNESPLCVIPKKAGKAKITLEYKLDGESYSTSATFTVVKYPNPIASLTVNQKKIKLTDMAKYRYCVDCKYGTKATVTINMKPKKGWKISAIKAYTLKTWSTKGKKTLKVKNNAKFTVAKDREVFITYTLKKGKTTFKYTVTVERYGE